MLTNDLDFPLRLKGYEKRIKKIEILLRVTGCILFILRCIYFLKTVCAVFMNHYNPMTDSTGLLDFLSVVVSATVIFPFLTNSFIATVIQLRCILPSNWSYVKKIENNIGIIVLIWLSSAVFMMRSSIEQYYLTTHHIEPIIWISIDTFYTMIALVILYWMDIALAHHNRKQRNIKNESLDESIEKKKDN